MARCCDKLWFSVLFPGLLADDANNKMESSDVVVPAAAGGQLKKRRHHIPTKKQITTKKVKQYMAKKARSCCSLQSLVRKIPAINWARNYNLDCLTGDLIAGLTCALTVIPQGIGYAPLAGLPLQVSFAAKSPWATAYRAASQYCWNAIITDHLYGHGHHKLFEGSSLDPRSELQSGEEEKRERVNCQYCIVNYGRDILLISSALLGLVLAARTWYITSSWPWLVIVYVQQPKQ